MAEEPVVDAAPAPPEGEPHLGVFVGAELYGLPLSRLREVASVTTVRRVPGAAPHVAGLVNLRGEIMCVLDARAILGLAPVQMAETGFVIALRDFDFPVGLVVDGIADIFPIDRAAVAAAPAEWRAEQRACVIGAASVPDGFIGLLDVDRMVNR